MTRRNASALALFLLAARPATALDVNDLVRTAAERQRDGERRSGGVAYHRLEVEVDVDGKGRREKVARRVFAVAPDGSGGIRRDLVEVDGRLPTDVERKTARKEEEKRRARTSRDGKGGDQDELMSGRPPLLDLLTRLDFELLGQEVIDGRPNHVVTFGPKPGLTSRTVRDRILNNFAGRAWIDAGEQQVTRIEGHLTRPAKVLGGIALDLRDVRIVYEERPALPEIWAPCREEILVVGKAGLVINVRKEIRIEFWGYRPYGEPGSQVARAGTAPGARPVAP